MDVGDPNQVVAETNSPAAALPVDRNGPGAVVEKSPDEGAASAAPPAPAITSMAFDERVFWMKRKLKSSLLFQSPVHEKQRVPLSDSEKNHLFDNCLSRNNFENGQLLMKFLDGALPGRMSVMFFLEHIHSKHDHKFASNAVSHAQVKQGFRALTDLYRHQAEDGAHAEHDKTVLQMFFQNVPEKMAAMTSAYFLRTKPENQPVPVPPNEKGRTHDHAA